MLHKNLIRGGPPRIKFLCIKKMGYESGHEGKIKCFMFYYVYHKHWGRPEMFVIIKIKYIKT